MRGTVGVALLLAGFLKLINAERTALGQEECLGHRSEYVVAQHGHEVGGGSLKGVSNGVLINSLNTNLSKVGNLTGDILAGVLNNTLNEVLKAALSVQHVLEAVYEALSGELFDLGALIVQPHHALTELEGVGQTVLGNSPGLSQCGNLVVLGVVLNQTVEGVNDCLGVSSVGGCKSIPGLGVGGVAKGVSISNGVALTGQEGLSPSEVLLAGGALSPMSLHLVTDSGSQGVLLNNNSGVVAIGIVAPENGGNGVRSNSGDGIDTTFCGRGEHNTGLKQLCLGDSHEGKSLGNGGGCLSGLVVLVELAENLLVEIVRDFGVVLACVRINRVSSARSVIGLAGVAAGEDGDEHDQRECEAQNFLAHCFSFLSFTIVRTMTPHRGIGTAPTRKARVKLPKK